MNKYKVRITIQKIVEGEVYGLNPKHAEERAHHKEEMDNEETLSEKVVSAEVINERV